MWSLGWDLPCGRWRGSPAGVEGQLPCAKEREKRRRKGEVSTRLPLHADDCFIYVCVFQVGGLPGDAGRGPVGTAGSLRAVSGVVEGPQGSWAVWWWRGPSGSWALA